MKEPLRSFEGFNITFNTNEDCNLACTYCYEVNKQKRLLDFDYAKRFIDILLTDPDPVGVKESSWDFIYKGGLVLEFIGGDAFMHPDLLDKILTYFIHKIHILRHKWRDNWRVSISTNGTLLNREDVRNFIYKYQNVISISVSVDGCKEVHDKNRVYLDGRGSLEDIEKNIPWLVSLTGPERLTTKSTLNKDSIPYLYKSLKYLFEDLHITQINQNFIFEDMDLSQEDLNLLDEQLKLCVDYMLQHSDDIYWGMIDKRFAEAVSFEENCRSNPDRGWCGSGAMPALGVDGKIYPCFRFLPHTQGSGVDLSVGNVWDGFNKKENFLCVREATREKISPQKCKDCEIESACSWCIAGSYSEKGYGYRQTYICEIQKLQAKWSKIYWNELNKRRGLS